MVIFSASQLSTCRAAKLRGTKKKPLAETTVAHHHPMLKTACNWALKGFGIHNTEYRTVSDLTHGRYFFELTTAPNVVWADLGRFDLAPGAPVMVLDPVDIALSGDVSESFGAAVRSSF